MSQRPLSPHIFIYRFAYTMALSILHRATGVAMSAGLVLLVAWLVALASGPERHAAFSAFAATWPVQAIIGLFIISFCFHLANGIRHLCWDIGWGLERQQARRSARIVVVAVVLSAALLLDNGINIPSLFGVAAVCNATVAVYIYGLVPEFRARFMAWIGLRNQ